MKNRILEIDEIKRILPHRYPFLFVDRVLETSDTYLKGYKNVTVNEEFFNGHFPQSPVMPGVLIVEALAQVACIHSMLCMEDSGLPIDKASPLFASIDSCKFKSVVRPGDQLMLEATFVKTKMNVRWYDCKATVNGKVATSCSISAVTVIAD